VRARGLGAALVVGFAAWSGAADAAVTARGTRTVSVCYRAPRPAGVDPIDFADVTEKSGLTTPLRGAYGHATAIGDVDADGWTDLFFGGFADKTVDADGVHPPDRLLRGGPEGFHIDESFSVEGGRTAGAAFADLDGDGDLDLVLSRNVRDWPGGRAPSIVMRNQRGKLTQASVLDARRSGRSIGVLDYDGDGRLDLYLVEDRFEGRGSSALLHNDGGLHFSNATADAGLPSDVEGLGVAATDLNGDRRSDLFVSGSNRLFVNTGGSFDEVASASSDFAWKRYGNEDDPAGVASGDLNRDGRTDLVIGQHYNSTIEGGRKVPVRVYVNQGNDGDSAPRFRDITESAGVVGLPTKAPHVEIADLDGDGWPDILTTASAGGGNGPAIFRSLGAEDGSPRFAAPDGTGPRQYWIAGATFDADRDGDLDVFVVEFDIERSSLLLRNDAARAHWLGIQVGRSGAAGVGTTVEVYRAGGLGRRSKLLGAQQMSTTTGFGSGSAPVAFFGLGDESEIDVRISGGGLARSVVLRRLAADRLVVSGAAADCED
jgi:enediyne biosynthesis protein E4